MCVFRIQIPSLGWKYEIGWSRETSGPLQCSTKRVFHFPPVDPFWRYWSESAECRYCRYLRLRLESSSGTYCSQGLLFFMVEVGRGRGVRDALLCPQTQVTVLLPSLKYFPTNIDLCISQMKSYIGISKFEKRRNVPIKKRVKCSCFVLPVTFPWGCCSHKGVVRGNQSPA